MNNNSLDNADSQTLANKIIIDYMREQRRRRIWRWIKSAVLLAVLVWVAYQITAVRRASVVNNTKDHVGVIDIKGTIAENQAANGDNIMKSLDRAYKSKNLQALILRIDSPGGSPVQADYIYNGLRYYHDKYPNIKTYAVCVDACASAAYYVAVAVDEIYANPASLVGSIGVLYNGYGFVDTMQKLGVTRRLYTAGRNKGFLDPFSPAEANQEKTLQTMLDLIHQQFISKVKQGRGNRLLIDDDTFSGLFWTGTQAKDRGLIDGFASTGQLAREVIKVEKLVDYTYKENLLERMAKNMGTAIANQLPEAMGIKPGLQ